MQWINFYGLGFMILIMVPNIIYALKRNSELQYKNKKIEFLEQIGRFGSMVFMVLSIPYCSFGFWFKHGMAIYLILNSVLCFLYCLFWILLWNKENKTKALVLSIIPSLIFIVSGVVSSNLFLILFSLIFAPAHITISLKSFLIRAKNH